MKKVLIHVLGTIIILGGGSLLFLAALSSENVLVQKTLEFFLASRAMPLIVNSGLSMVFYMDAVKRKMPYAWLWCVGMFSFPIIGIVIYLMKRPPLPEPPERTSRLCPNCGKYYEPSVNYCPHCGSRVGSE